MAIFQDEYYDEYQELWKVDQKFRPTYSIGLGKENAITNCAIMEEKQFVEKRICKKILKNVNRINKSFGNFNFISINFHV